MDTTPASLLERLRGPFDANAWARFVALYAPMIHSWSRRVGQQDQDAADLTQDVFVALIQVLPGFTYDRHKSFRRWLRTVTLNMWRNARRERIRSVDLDPRGDPALIAGPGELESLWESEYRQRLVGRALDLMKSDFHESTWKACWETAAEGRPAATVAGELGMTVGAVYAARFRVLNRLRAELNGMLD